MSGKNYDMLQEMNFVALWELKSVTLAFSRANFVPLLSSV